MIRVLVADDHDLVRAGLSRMLDDIADLDVVGGASSGEEAYDFCRKSAVDVVLMDLRMPGIGGMEATRKIAQAEPSIKVIAVTACEDDPFPAQFLKAGAVGFLTKDADISEIVEAIRTVHRGGRYLSNPVANQMALKSVSDQGSPFDALSERELQICMMIIDCLKASEIAEKLSVTAKTVNSFRYRIFDKLGISGDVELTKLALRHGLIDINEGTSG